MLSYRILCAGRCEQPSERHDRCDAGGGELLPPPASTLPPPTNQRGGVLVGPCGAGEARGVGPGGESRVLAAGPTPALPPWRAAAQYTPLAANRDSPHRTALRAAAVHLRAVDTEMIPPPSPTPAPHPPTICCGVLRGGGSVCARTYQRRPRNTGAATGILPISLSGETKPPNEFPAAARTPKRSRWSPIRPERTRFTSSERNIQHRVTPRADGRDNTVNDACAALSRRR